MVAEINNNSRLSVRFARKQDVTTVMEFIGKYWKSGHILSYDRELFDYLYLERDENLNFVIATEISSSRLVAILGFIPTNSSRSRVSLALWKAVNDKELRAMQPGLACFRFLIKELSPKSLFCVGINDNTRVIYEFMGYSTGLMDHHIVLNKNLKDYKIIINPPSHFQTGSVANIENYTVNRIHATFELKTAVEKLNLEKYGKDFNYFCHRYIEHPKFHYEIIEVLEMDQVIGLVIYRRCFVDKNSCIRIIDVVGGVSCLKGALSFLNTEMVMFGDEYIDLVSWGIDKDELKSAGFTDRREFIDCVVPEHFSPFSPINKDTWVFSNLPHVEQLLKGDGDHDRPN